MNLEQGSAGCGIALQKTIFTLSEKKSNGFSVFLVKNQLREKTEGRFASRFAGGAHPCALVASLTLGIQFD
jgi:hypothetical protein